MCFQGEQNKPLQRNLNAVHVNVLPQSHVPAEIIARLLMKDSRPMPDDLIIVLFAENGSPGASVNEVDGNNFKCTHTKTGCTVTVMRSCH